MSEHSLPRDVRGVHIHFVGIKGTGMAALVEIMHSRGAVITGSDVSERFYTDEILEKLGLAACTFSESNITDAVQYVIYSSAYNPDTNPDLIAARRRNIPCMLYTQALGALSQTAFSCGICGVHGKTTTTGLTGTLLKELHFPAQVLAGSVIASFGNSCTMTSDTCAENGHKYFVAETCEYQRHFMSFCPQKIILTSVESDHQDYYPTYNDIRDAFIDYICRLPAGGELIYCADDAGAVETAAIAKERRPDIVCTAYGEQAFGSFRLSFGQIKDGLQFFTLQGLGEFALCVPGRHMVRNACAAIALCCSLLQQEGRSVDGASLNCLKEGLLRFTGGRRRSEIVGRAVTPAGESVIFIDDYGHHPTAIRTTLAGYREFYRGRKIIVDFMAHTYSRTQALMDEFAASFNDADEIILHKIYSSARENAADFTVTGRTLFEHAQKNYGSRVRYFDDFAGAAQALEKELACSAGPEYPDGYLVVTMGAGDNWKVASQILKTLEEQK